MFKFDQKLTTLPISPSFTTISIQKFKKTNAPSFDHWFHIPVYSGLHPIPTEKTKITSKISIIFQKNYHVFHPFLIVSFSSSSTHQCFLHNSEGVWVLFWMKVNECGNCLHVSLFFLWWKLSMFVQNIERILSNCFDELVEGFFAFNWTGLTVFMWKDNVTWQYVRVDHWKGWPIVIFLFYIHPFPGAKWTDR